MPLYHLCSIPSVSCSYLIIPCVFPTWYHLHLFTRSCMPVLTTRFSMHVYISDLSIHVWLSSHATSQHHSLRSSDSLGSSCPGFRVWRLWILPVTDQRCAAVAWIIGNPSEALFFQACCASLEFSFCKLVITLCTVHTCISPCILPIAPISDVMFL